MRSVYVLFALLIWAGTPMATGVPEIVAVTPENSASLGFELIELGSGTSTSNVTVVQLRFPSRIDEKLEAWRAQTYLFDVTGEQVSSTSVDYKFFEGEPQLLIHFNHDQNDAAIVVQYFCPQENGSECAKAYTIESVKDYLSGVGPT